MIKRLGATLTWLARYLFIGLALGMIAIRAPSLWREYQLEGKPAPQITVSALANVPVDGSPPEGTALSGTPLKLPIPSQRQIIVFWATWCGPCQVELSRLNKMVASKEVKATDIIAISSFEDIDLVRRTSLERQYGFQVAVDPQGRAAQRYHIEATPTIFFIDKDSRTNWATAGMSATLGLRAALFLKSDDK